MAEYLPPVDVTNCDQEPIHIPGSVQPHGILLVVDLSSFEIIQAAGETDRFLGRNIVEIVGHSIEEVFGRSEISQIHLLSGHDKREPVYVGSVNTAPDARHSLDLTAHERDGLLLLELEPAAAPRELAAQILAKLRVIATELEAALDLAQLCQAAARAMRRLTGFDRVMIYRFLDDGAGCVVAEDKIPELPPFLNHHYPASDIPRQARALYVRNLIRVIPDVNYTPAPLLPAPSQPLDMSECSLRSVSPIHIQYLKNMGVAASMSVSLVRDGNLWGLIACHHTTPKLVPYELREACKHIGQILAQQIRAREEADLHIEALRLGAARDELIRSAAQDEAVEAALMRDCATVRALIPADGAVILYREDIAQVGHTPAEAQIRQLADWFMASDAPDPYVTDCLSERYSPALAYANEASGLLATVVSREDRFVLLWFRAEHVETINWAGNPHMPIEPRADAGTLNPRKSFDLWKETVRNRSRSWSSAEVDAARRFREAVFDLRQQQKLRDLNVQLARKQAEALAAQEREELQQKRAQLEHVARLATLGELTATVTHELAQPLGAILLNSASGIALLDAPQPDLQEIRETFFDINRTAERTEDVIRGMRDMLKRDTPGLTNVDLNELIRSVARIVRSDANQHRVEVQLDLSPGVSLIKGDTVQLQQVMLNLMLNAFSAMSGAELNGARRLIVRTNPIDGSNVQVEVQDSGTGIPPDKLQGIFEPFITSKPEGLGMGLSICRTIIERHGGTIWAANNPDRGATFSITLPVTCE